MDLTQLREEIQRQRKVYHEQACDHSELAGHEEQEARAFGRVEAYDEVLELLDAPGEG